MKGNVDLEKLLAELDNPKLNLTRIRAIAKELGKDQALADEYWAKGKRNYRLLALLVFDPKKIDGRKLDSLAADIEEGEKEDRTQVSDWLLSNVVFKNAQLMEAVDSWGFSESVTKLRLYWQYKARTVDTKAGDLNAALLRRIENELRSAHESVQWTMNWCAASIGIEDEALRDRCVKLGEEIGLYRDYPTPKGCTSPYLPSWIGAVVKKKAGK